MLLYVQAWLPLVIIVLTAAISFAVASLVMGRPYRRTPGSSSHPPAPSDLTRAGWGGGIRNSASRNQIC